MKLRQGRSRIFQVMPDIEQNQVGDRPLLEIQRIGVLHAIQPGIWKEIGRKRAGVETPAEAISLAREIASAGLCGLGLYWFVQRGYALLSP